MQGLHQKRQMPAPDQALQGRNEAMQISAHHYVNGNPLQPPFPGNMQQALFGLGCFRVAEQKYWQAAGVFSTAVGYAAGYTPNPTYEDVCSGRTAHIRVNLGAILARILYHA